MQAKLVDLSGDGVIATMTLRDPVRRNALTAQMKDELIAAIGAAGARVVILTGADSNFCSGGDLASMDGLTEADAIARTAVNARLVKAIYESQVIFLAAVEGWAAGGGLSLAALCDIVVAARSARFVAGFSAVGLTPDLGALWMLPRRIGIGRTNLLIHSGRRIDAETAAAWGLVDELAEPGRALGTARALAREIAEKAPAATATAKQILNAGHGSFQALVADESARQAELMISSEAQEGRQAFFEKREPHFHR